MTIRASAYAVRRQRITIFVKTMSFKEWLQAMPFEFWLGFAVTVIPFFIVIYQLHRGRQSTAANIFLLVTISIVGALVWIFFGRPHQEKLTLNAWSAANRSWRIAMEEPWKNAWPNMVSVPDAVLREVRTGTGIQVLSMRIEGVGFDADHTILRVTVKNGTEGTTAKLEPGAGAYVVDDRGRSYNFQDEVRYGEGPFPLNGEVRPTAVEHFALLFPLLPSTGSILFKHPQFLPMTIYEYKPPPANVLFCRPSRYAGALIGMNIYCDGQQVAHLGAGESVRTQLDFGKHACQANWKPLWHEVVESQPVEVDVLSERDYYVQAASELANFGLIMRPTLKAVSTEAECTTTQ